MATTAHRGVAIGILLVATFMDLLDVTMVQVALPAVGADLQASEDSLDWVVSGYMLAFAMGLVTGGRLGDILGRKRIFLIGTVGFTLASVVCTTAWMVEVLVAARVLQGLFAAIMVPQLLASVQSLFAPKERTPWYGVIGASTGIAAVAGPLLGGVRVDLPGGVLLSAAVLCGMVRLVEGRRRGWPAWLWFPVAAGGGLLIAFVVRCQRRQSRDGSAVLPLALFRDRGFSAGVITQAAFQGSMNAFTLPLMFYLQLALGYSALGAGLNLLAFSLGSVAATAIAVPLVPRLGRYLVTIGAAFMATGFLWTLTILGAEGDSFTAWAAVVPMLLAGVGLSAIVIPLVDVALATVPIDDAGAASRVLTTSQQLGPAIGVAASMTVFSAVLDGDWSRAQALDALRASVTVAVIGMGVAAATSFALPGVRAVRRRQQSLSHTTEPTPPAVPDR